MSLSKSIGKHYGDSKHEVSYGSVDLAPLQFVDDALRLTTTVEGARDSSKRFEAVMGSKGLEVNILKSIYMISGKKKNIENIRNELANRPLLYKGSVLKEKNSDKWLGSMLSPKGTKESTVATIDERKIRI